MCASIWFIFCWQSFLDICEILISVCHMLDGTVSSEEVLLCGLFHARDHQQLRCFLLYMSHASACMWARAGSCMFGMEKEWISLALNTVQRTYQCLQTASTERKLIEFIIPNMHVLACACIHALAWFVCNERRFSCWWSFGWGGLCRWGAKVELVFHLFTSVISSYRCALS